MINFKVFYNKILLKYIIIFLALFTAIISFFIYFEYINVSINEKIESKENRTLSLTFNSNVDYNQILNNYKNKILSYECNDNNCILIFDKVSSLMQFKKNNINNIEKLLVGEITNNENNYIIKNILTFVIVISCVTFLILLFLFSKNIIYNLKKDIALYKLVGFSNIKICNIMFRFLGIYYFLLLIISSILGCFIMYVVIGIEMELKWNCLFNCMFIISLCLLLSFLQLTFKIKKVTPMEMINSSS